MAALKVQESAIMMAKMTVNSLVYLWVDSMAHVWLGLH